MNKIKDFIKDIPNNVWVYILIAVIGAIAVIWFCGIKGNNETNFYYHPKTEIAQADTTAKKPIVTIHPRKPFIARGVNVVNGKVVKG